MAISTKYGKIDIPNIADDEPIFVLRAQDRWPGTPLKLPRSGGIS